MILYYVVYMRPMCSSSLGEEETGWSGVQLGVRLDICRLRFFLFFFFFLGLVPGLLNGGSDLSVLTDRNPCVGKSHSQRVGVFTC